MHLNEDQTKVRKEFHALFDSVKMCEECGGCSTGFCAFGTGQCICIECAGRLRGDHVKNRVINYRGTSDSAVMQIWIEKFNTARVARGASFRVRVPSTASKTKRAVRSCKPQAHAVRKSAVRKSDAQQREDARQKENLLEAFFGDPLANLSK